MRLPRTPRAVVFDLDGTLIDSEMMVRESYRVAARQFGVTMSDTLFLSLVGLHRDANDWRMREFYGAEFPLDDFYAAARTWMGERVAPLKPGVVELLDLLDRRRLPYAVATASTHAWIDRHFTAHNIRDRFAARIGRGDYANAKPHPEPYLTAAAALSADPAFTLAIEDSHTGVRSAHAAGMMTVMAPDLLGADDEMAAKTVAIVTSLDDVRALIGEP